MYFVKSNTLKHFFSSTHLLQEDWKIFTRLIMQHTRLDYNKSFYLSIYPKMLLLQNDVLTGNLWASGIRYANWWPVSTLQSWARQIVHLQFDWTNSSTCRGLNHSGNPSNLNSYKSSDVRPIWDGHNSDDMCQFADNDVVMIGSVSIRT